VCLEKRVSVRWCVAAPEILLNVDIKQIPVRLLQSAGDISTSRITAVVHNRGAAATWGAIYSANTFFYHNIKNTFSSCHQTSKQIAMGSTLWVS